VGGPFNPCLSFPFPRPWARPSTTRRSGNSRKSPPTPITSKFTARVSPGLHSPSALDCTKSEPLLLPRLPICTPEKVRALIPIRAGAGLPWLQPTYHPPVFPDTFAGKTASASRRERACVLQKHADAGLGWTGLDAGFDFITRRPFCNPPSGALFPVVSFAAPSISRVAVTRPQCCPTRSFSQQSFLMFIY
jgi:hypothetical protein